MEIQLSPDVDEVVLGFMEDTGEQEADADVPKKQRFKGNHCGKTALLGVCYAGVTT